MHLGVDIGGTSVRVGAFSGLHDTESLASDSFQVTGDYDTDFGRLRKMCTLLRDHQRPVMSIGIAIAGVVDKDRTTLAKAGNTKQWVGQPFVKVLSGIFGCQVVLGNDAEAAGLAEAEHGNPDGGDFWFVIWGTGIGGTLVRHPYDEPLANAGEVGHLPLLHPYPRICECGQKDCWEAYCGGAMIQKYDGVPAEQLVAEQWTVVLDNMAAGLRSIVCSQPVERVYFGGGIAAKQPQFIPVLEEMLRQDFRIVEAPSLQLSRFGESAGTVGALVLLSSELV